MAQQKKQSESQSPPPGRRKVVVVAAPSTFSWENLPELFRLHINKILVGLIAVALVVLLLRYRTQAANERLETARAALTSARGALDQLRQISPAFMDPDKFAEARQQLATQLDTNLGTVIEKTDDHDAAHAPLRAEAILARGDLYWTLANQPALAAAATRPTLNLPTSSADLLKKAEAEYKHVIDQYGSEVAAKTSAQFGLAAIAENRRDWDAAKQQYQAIIADPKLYDGYHALAERRMAELDHLAKPVLLGTPHATTTPTTGASTMPATLPTATTAPNATTRSTATAPTGTTPVDPATKPATTQGGK